MKRRAARGILGLALVVLGLVYAGNVLNLWNISINFDGWWTVFIIFPCLYGMISDGIHFGNALGLSIGVLLLISAQGLLPHNAGYKLIFPLIVVAVGIKIIFTRGFSSNDKCGASHPNISRGGKEVDHIAVFCGNDINYSGQLFSGANCVSVFGGIELDLRDAIIEQDCAIDVCSIFGGTDILMPPNVKVLIDSVPIFGGVSNKFASNPADNAPKVIINAVSVFGGTDIK